jgi:hypothetical protein
MRSRRLSSIAGWATVGVLALAGFAAFGSPGPSAAEVQLEAEAASLGHTSGAYAGMAFAVLGPAGDAEVAATSEPVDTASSEEEPATSSTQAAGTIAPDAGWLSEVEVRALISIYFAPEDVNRAVRIAWCESRFDPKAVNLRTGAVGLFQHLPRYWGDRAENAGFDGADPTDAEASTAAAAWEIYQGSGWDVFNCSS